MKRIHRIFTIALVSCLTPFLATAETPDEIKASCLKGDVIQKSAARGAANLLKRCLDAGTPVDSADGNSWTPLHAAAFNGKLKIVKQLLERGADYALKDKNGKTPLDLAVGKEHNDIATTLKAKKALDNSRKQLTTTDPKTLELADALAFDLTHYRPKSPENTTSFMVLEVLSIKSAIDGEDSTVIKHTMSVKFKRSDTTEAVIYEGEVSEDADGHLSAYIPY